MAARVAGVLAAGLAVLNAVPGGAVTLRVPSEYATIQAGLDASVAGDTVLVAPGTYTDWETRSIVGPRRLARSWWTAWCFGRRAVLRSPRSTCWEP